MPKKQPEAAFQEPSLAEPEKHQCFLMFLTGFGPSEIEQRTGIRADRIRQWMCREEWTKQKEHYENLLREKNPVASQPIVKAVTNARKGELKQKFIENMGEIAAEDAEAWKDMQPQERIVVAPAIASLGALHRKTFDLDKESGAGEKSHISLTFLTNSANLVKLIEPEKVKVIEDAK